MIKELDTANCAACEQLFEVPRTNGRPRTTCSPKCRTEHRRNLARVRRMRWRERHARKA